MLQRPSQFAVPGLPASPFWDLPDISLPLEQSHTTIMKEYATLATCPSRLQSSLASTHTIKGTWDRLFLLYEGEWKTNNCMRCPATVSLIKSLPLCETQLGSAYFSVLAPGTKLLPTFGSTNVTLRAQLCLSGDEKVTPIYHVLMEGGNVRHVVELCCVVS